MAASGIYKGILPRKTTPTQGGLASRKSPEGYDENQLRLGIGVEAEHTTDKKLAMKIAMDHLEENPQYYTQLPDPDQAAHQGATMEALGMKEAGGMLMYQGGGDLPWQETYGKGANSMTLNAPMLAKRHEDLKNLKYLDIPDTDWGSLAMNIGGSALSAYTGAGGSFGGGSSAFNIAQTGAGQSIQQLGQNQLKGTGVNDLIGSLSGVLGTGVGGDNKLGGQFNQMEKGGELPKYQVSQEQYDQMVSGLSDTQQDGYVPIYQDGGQLLGYLPEHSFGSWLGDNAGKILKGVGGVVSVIPGFGQIAGPILIGAGYATDAIVGKVRKNRAEDEAVTAAQREEVSAGIRDDAADYKDAYDASNNVSYGATFEMGGGLMDSPANSQVPMITEYGSKSNSHQEGVGGIPVDARGNPSAVSKQSAVGLTERGEVTWNGYVFSDKLTT